MISARAARLIAALVTIRAVAGCLPPAPVVETIAMPPVGISIALYRDGETSYAVVDDRRFVETTGTTLVLEHVDPGAALPSLVIESLGGDPLAVGQCAREHVRVLRGESDREAEGDADSAREDDSVLVDSALRCEVTGAPGRHLVRLLYVSPGLSYRAQHDVTMTGGDRATVATRFAITTPAWSTLADVTLFDGLPGGGRAPTAIGRGAIQLDGSTAVVGGSHREVGARLRWIYDGAVRAARGVETDAMWGRESVRSVWVWLELEDRDLPPGPVHAHVESPGEAIRDVEVPAAGRERLGDTLRLPLWIDDTLHGLRTRVVIGADGASLADRFVISVANNGTEPRDVWVEERLRTTARRTLRSGWPMKPTLAHGRAQTRLLIKPGAMARTGYVIEYVF